MAKTRYLVKGVPLNPDPDLPPHQDPGTEIVLDLSAEAEERLVSHGALARLGPYRDKAEKPKAEPKAEAKPEPAPEPAVVETKAAGTPKPAADAQKPASGGKGAGK